MSTPFTGNIVGSWLLVRSTYPDEGKRIVYHFLADGKLRSEDENIEGKRELLRMRYRVEGSTFTLILNRGTYEQDHPLTVEDDGSVKIEGKDNHAWWIVRLVEPGPRARRFVNEAGELVKVDAAAEG